MTGVSKMWGSRPFRQRLNWNPACRWRALFNQWVTGRKEVACTLRHPPPGGSSWLWMMPAGEAGVGGGRWAETQWTVEQVPEHNYPERLELLHLSCWHEIVPLGATWGQHAKFKFGSKALDSSFHRILGLRKCSAVFQHELMNLE